MTDILERFDTTKDKTPDIFEGVTMNIVEAADKKKRPGVLMTVEGNFGIINKKNRNGRTYKKDLWEKVMNSPDFKRKMGDRSYLGEADHPPTFHASLARASHVLTDLRLEGDDLKGKVDVLDTPSGRVLGVLFKAGVNVGISSRGAGSLVKEGSKVFVNDKDYRFGGFDFVTEPSAQNAYPKVSEALTEECKGEICQILQEGADEVIQEKDYYSKLAVNTVGETPNVLQEQDEEAYQKLLEEAQAQEKSRPLDILLEEARRKAVEELQDDDSKEVALRMSIESLKTERANLEKELAELKPQLEANSSNEEALRIRITEMEGALRESYLNREAEQDTDPEQENREAESKIQSAVAQNRIKALTEEVADLKSQLVLYDETITRCASLREQVAELETAVSKVDSYHDDLDMANESIQQLESQLNEAEIQINAVRESKALLEKENLDLYVEAVSLREGISLDELDSQLEEGFTREDVDAVVQSLNESLIEEEPEEESEPESSVGRPLPTSQSREPQPFSMENLTEIRALDLSPENSKTSKTKKTVKNIIKKI